jgi:hypothetical protein
MSARTSARNSSSSSEFQSRSAGAVVLLGHVAFSSASSRRPPGGVLAALPPASASGARGSGGEVEVVFVREADRAVELSEVVQIRGTRIEVRYLELLAAARARTRCPDQVNCIPASSAARGCSPPTSTARCRGLK